MVRGSYQLEEPPGGGRIGSRSKETMRPEFRLKVAFGSVSARRSFGWVGSALTAPISGGVNSVCVRSTEHGFVDERSDGGRRKPVKMRLGGQRQPVVGRYPGLPSARCRTDSAGALP